MRQIFFIAATIFLMSDLSFAQGTSSASINSEKEKQKVKKFSLLLSIDTSSDLRKTDDVDSVKGTELLINPSYSINENLKASLSTILSKPLSGEEKEDLLISNTLISLSHPLPTLIGDIKTSGSLLGSLPTNKESREIDLLNGSLGVQIGLSKQIGILGLGYNIRGFQNFHQYTLDRTGSANVETNLRHQAAINISIQRTTFEVSGQFTTAKTYRGFIREKFALSQDISYQLDDQSSISIGHTNEGPAFKSNGRDSNISFFDENDSYFHAGLSHLF